MKTSDFKILAVSVGIIGFLTAHSLAFAAKGFIVTPAQVASIQVGMTAAEVRDAIGRPAHSLKFRKIPGGTWIYDVNQIESGETHTVFYVDFGANLRVISTSERLETNETEF